MLSHKGKRIEEDSRDPQLIQRILGKESFFHVYMGPKYHLHPLVIHDTQLSFSVYYLQNGDTPFFSSFRNIQVFSTPSSLIDFLLFLTSSNIPFFLTSNSLNLQFLFYLCYFPLSMRWPPFSFPSLPNGVFPSVGIPLRSSLLRTGKADKLHVL